MPRWFYIVRLRLRSLFLRDRAEQELHDEIDDHLARRTDELIARGMPAPNAALAAQRSFGGVEQRKEECRDMRRVGWLEDAVHDLRYGARLMRRHPAIALAAILSLAIGIGANTALFSVFDALLLRPVPVERPDQLRVPNFELRLGHKLAKSGTRHNLGFVQPFYVDRSVFSDVIAFGYLEQARIRVGDRHSFASEGVFVSDNYFSMLGVTLQRGRAFSPAAAGQSPELSVVVISDRMWRRDLEANPTAVGSTISINGVPFTIIGIAPREFFGLTLGRVADLYLPLDATAMAQPGLAMLAERRSWMVQLVGRVKPGITEPAAEAALTALAATNMRDTAPGTHFSVDLLPIDTGLSGVRQRFLQPFSILMAMVGALLLIGCANVATLLLARASARKTEIAVRTTLGAGRARIVRQLAVESALLTALACALGVAFTIWSGDALVRLLPSTTTTIDVQTGIDLRVLIFAIIVSSIAAMLSGLIPAFHAAKVDFGTALRERTQVARTIASGRLSATFVVAEVALCVALLAGAGLLLRTLNSLAALDPGFDPRGLVLADVSPEARMYDAPRTLAYYREVVERLRATPGVTSVSLSQLRFLSLGRTTGTVDIPGYSPANEEDRWVQVYQVGADFFSTLGMTLIAGRDFTDADLHGERVAAINETAARRFFGGTSAIGRTMGADNPYRIIAVVRDARYNTLRDETIAVLFVPYTDVRARGRMSFAVRTADIDGAAGLVASAIRSIDRLVPVEVTTLEETLTRSLGQERLLAMIASLFAAVAVLLVSLGIYGVMAFWVSERTSEIGVRLALGAARAQVVWTVLRRPLALVVTGSALGVLLVVGASRFLNSLLYGLSGDDPVTIAAGILLMLIVGITAGWLPARRASRVDPIAALRCE